MIADKLNYSCRYIGMSGDKIIQYISISSSPTVATTLDGGTKKRSIIVLGVDLGRGANSMLKAL